MFRPLAIAFALVTACNLVFVAPAGAQQEQALLMEGRSTLFQQVITRVGARLVAEPGAVSNEPELEPFTIFYVYARENGWLRVGAGARTGPLGWIEEDKAIDWKTTIVVAFNDPTLYSRERALLFRTREELAEVICCEDVLTRVAELQTQVAAGELPPGSPVISVEPETHVDIDRNFYILPILSAERRPLHFGIRGRFLEVASVVREEPEPIDPNENFRAGIAFVVDTTISMGPYIAGTRDAIGRIRGRIEASEYAENIRFGLTGFRQNPEVSPGIDYHTRTYLRLDESATPARFSEVIRTMLPATTSTQGFNEDSVGGIVAAVQATDWSSFAARFVFLVTDAGPRDSQNPDIVSPMLPEQVSTYLKENGILPIVLHLKTPQGLPDHENAENAYRAMALPGGGIYLEIPGGEASIYRSQIDAVADEILGHLATAAAGGIVEAPPPTDQSASARLQRAWRAMQLSYLAAQQGQQAPDIFRAWMIDRALEDPGKDALDVRIMLTRNQLATLRDVAENIIDRAEEGLSRLDSRDFFTQLREAVAVLSRDPDRLARTDFESLGDALGEYISDLPYESEMLTITEETWARMSGPQKRALVTRLRSKIELYERIYESPDRWVRLHADAPDGERVTTLPLREMP